jgi:hypothetical protein
VALLTPLVPPRPRIGATVSDWASTRLLCFEGTHERHVVAARAPRPLVHFAARRLRRPRFPLAALGVSETKSAKGGDGNGKLLRHVVLFQFKESVTPEQVKEVVDAFAALPEKIDAIEDFEWGTDVSVENKSAGFTHGFVVTFRNEAGRDAYLPHPAHQKFVELVGPRLEGALVFDYWAKR